MDCKLIQILPFLSLLLSLSMTPGSLAQSSTPPPFQGTRLVDDALAAELSAVQDLGHPMRYRLHKSSTRLTSTKEIVETRDGAVALLLAVNDQPPSDADAQKEAARLDGLLADPGRQQRRKRSQNDDMARALKVLRALPKAFLYQYAGTTASSQGRVQKFTFTPNPKFNPADLETQTLTALAGEIWIDADRRRVVRLEGHLQDDVDFGWGILGRVNKGGWIVIDQAEVAADQWRIVRFKMVMSGRVFFKTRNFDTTEEETRFVPVPTGLSYQQGIQMLREGQKSSETGAR